MNEYYKNIIDSRSDVLTANLNNADKIHLDKNQLHNWLIKERLTAKIAALSNNEILSIGEIGFGCGLNFLSIIDIWNDTNKAEGCTLNFFSIEESPTTPSNLPHIHKLAQFKNQHSESLCQQYYLLLHGYHRICIAPDIDLTLAIGDHHTVLREFDYHVDFWFINDVDKNTVNYLSQLSQACKENTDVFLYMKNDEPNIINYLQNAKVYQVNQQYNICHGIINTIKPKQKTWQNQLIRTLSKAKIQDIAIIGAGISGAATAFSLAKRGYKVYVYEQNESPALEASGNYQGMLYGSWSSFGGNMMELSSSAYRYTHYLIKQKLNKHVEFDECGIIQLAHNLQQSERNQQLINSNFPPEFITAVNNQQIENISGIKLGQSTNGVYFTSGIWLNPPSLVNKLLQHKNIQVINNCNINKLEHIDGNWQIYDSNNNLINQISAVVLCNSHAINQFEQVKHLSIRKIRGQISIQQGQNNLKTILCGNGYITPNKAELYTFGATFQFNDEDRSIRAQDHQHNIDNFTELLPELMNIIDINKLAGQTNFRASPYDYMPYVGPVAKYEEFKLDFAKLRKDKNVRIKAECQYHPNLFINVGHGAKGMLTAPFSGEIIADYIDNSIIACSESLRKALHPNRVYIRELVYNLDQQ